MSGRRGQPDWEEVGEAVYGVPHEVADLATEFASRRVQIPMGRHDLRLNERGGFYRWVMILEIVSLERSAPFLAGAGLAGLDPAVLRVAAREALERFAAVEEDEDDETLEEAVAAFDGAVDRVAADLGPDAGERFLAYCEYPYFSSESIRERDWDRLLGKLFFDHDHRSRLVRPELPPEALDAVRRAVHDHVDRHLIPKIDTADAAPLSPWDEWVYARCDGWSPLDVLWGLVSHYEILDVWRAVEAALTEEEVAALVEWGRRQAAELPGMRPEEVAPPPTPRRWYRS